MLGGLGGLRLGLGKPRSMKAGGRRGPRAQRQLLGASHQLEVMTPDGFDGESRAQGAAELGHGLCLRTPTTCLPVSVTQRPRSVLMNIHSLPWMLRRCLGKDRVGRRGVGFARLTPGWSRRGSRRKTPGPDASPQPRRPRRVLTVATAAGAQQRTEAGLVAALGSRRPESGDRGSHVPHGTPRFWFSVTVDRAQV